jgi:uncharacterized protein
LKVNKHEKIKVIWRFIDGKAGHDRQSLALAQSIKNRTKCRIFDINVQSQRNPILNIIFKNYMLPKGITKPDIAIGAGHKTHLHLLAVKRCFKAKIIVIMKPSLPLHFFDLCIISRHDCVKSRPNIFITQTSLVSFNSNIKKRENVGLFMIGGPSKHYYWDTKYVLQQIQNISKKFKLKEFLLTTSRRTPLSFVSEFNNLELNNLQIFDYSKIEDGWLDKNINRVKNIWVTNDSYSMLIEAIASGAHTNIIDLAIKKDSKLTNEINIVKGKLSKKLPIQNEAKRVAEFIDQLWF